MKRRGLEKKYLRELERDEIAKEKARAIKSTPTGSEFSKRICFFLKDDGAQLSPTEWARLLVAFEPLISQWNPPEPDFKAGYYAYSLPGRRKVAVGPFRDSIEATLYIRELGIKNWAHGFLKGSIERQLLTPDLKIIKRIMARGKKARAGVRFSTPMFAEYLEKPEIAKGKMNVKQLMAALKRAKNKKAEVRVTDTQGRETESIFTADENPDGSEVNIVVAGAPL